MIRLLVADDHPVVRSGVRNLFRDAPDVRVAAEASTAAEVLIQIANREFDVILLDISFPDGDGLELLRTIRERRPRLPAIVFTNAADAAARSLEAGAAGFVSKEAGLEELRSAIGAATSGRIFISSRGVSAIETGENSTPEQLPHLRLSPRELDVMMRLVRGMRPKEIAFELNISEKTVATHRVRLLRKLNLNDTRQLLLYALRYRLTDWS